MLIIKDKGVDVEVSVPREYIEGTPPTDRINITSNGEYLIHRRTNVNVDIYDGHIEIEQLKARIVVLNGEIATLENSLSEALNQIEIDNNTIAQLEAAISQKNTEIEALNATISQLQARLNSITSKTITANGTYTPEAGVEGWNSVEVNVPSIKPIITDKYFYFLSEEDNSFVEIGEHTATLEYSLDGVVWNNLTPGKYYLNNGEIMYLRGINPDGLYNNGFFSIRGERSVAIGGRLMSLIDYTSDSEVAPANAFNQLFNGNENIVDAEKLILPSVVGEGAFFSAFRFGHPNFRKLPYLNYKSVDGGYYDWRINNLEEVEIGANVFDLNRCFEDCSKLKKIKVHFTDWNRGVYFWHNHIAENGVFIKPKALNEEYGDHRIPVGWTVINYDDTDITENGTYDTTEIDKITVNVDTGEEEIEELNRQIALLNERISDLQITITSLETAITELENEKIQLQIEINQLNAQIESLNSEIATKDATITSLQTQIEALQARLNSITSKTITANGIYAPEEGIEGWDSIEVNVTMMSYLEMTQAEYDALTTKDNNVFYVING